MGAGHFWTQPNQSPSTADRPNASGTPPNMGGERHFAQGFQSHSDDSGSQNLSSRPSPSSADSPSPVESITGRRDPTGRYGVGGLQTSTLQWAQPPASWPPEDTEQVQATFRTGGVLGPLDHALDSGYGDDVNNVTRHLGDDRIGYKTTEALQRMERHAFTKPQHFESWKYSQHPPSVDDVNVYQHIYLPTHDVATRTATEQHQASLETMRMGAHQRFSSWAAQPKAPSTPDHSRPQVPEASQYGGQAPSSHHREARQPLLTEHDVDLHEVLARSNYQARYGMQSFAETQSGSSASSPYRNEQSHQQHGVVNLNITLAPLRSTTNLIPRMENGEQEFSVFVGDLCPDLREEDLINQFLHPPPWPPSHPLAIAVSNAQQAQGFYGMLPRLGPAPFLDTKSATVMTDPLTGASRGFGFVRFASEADCARALLEMQGVIVQPLSGQGGRPLRVCPATPKNRSSLYPQPPPNVATYPLAASTHQTSLQERLASSYQAQQQDSNGTMEVSGYGALPTTPTALSPVRSGAGESLASYSTSAMDPNNSTVFVGGLSSLISEETLKTFFSPFGEIKYVKIPPGKGCGFVQFVLKGDAERAIERMQGFPIGGGRIRLSWGRSQGDKAVAAATYAAAQAAQIGRLAGVLGLNASATSQLTAAALNALASGTPNGNDAHSLLVQRLATAAQAGLKFDSSGVGLLKGDWSSSDLKKEQDQKSLLESHIADTPYRQALSQGPAHLLATAESPVSVPEHGPSPWSDQERNETLHRRSRTETDETLSGMLSDLSFCTPTPRRHMTVTERHAQSPYGNTGSHIGRSTDVFNSPEVPGHASPDPASTWFASSQLVNNQANIGPRRAPMPSLPENDTCLESFNPFGAHEYTSERAAPSQRY